LTIATAISLWHGRLKEIQKWTSAQKLMEAGHFSGGKGRTVAEKVIYKTITPIVLAAHYGYIR
jgi:hypothetical protein